MMFCCSVPVENADIPEIKHASDGAPGTGPKAHCWSLVRDVTRGTEHSCDLTCLSWGQVKHKTTARELFRSLFKACLKKKKNNKHACRPQTKYYVALPKWTKLICEIPMPSLFLGSAVFLPKPIKAYKQCFCADRKLALCWTLYTPLAMVCLVSQYLGLGIIQRPKII